MRDFGRLKRGLLTVIAAILTLVTVLAFCACGDTAGENIESEEKSMFIETDQVTDYVRITMENGHTIVIRLFPQYVPNTVANFQELVSRHFYDGLIFHRVMSGFMIQGGDPLGNGTGGSGKTIKAEFFFYVDGQKTIIPHKRGVVSMAREEHNIDSASSQFFICHQDASWLNGDYAAFGYVVEGMETVDEIAAVQTDGNDKPLVEQKMRTVRFVKLKE